MSPSSLASTCVVRPYRVFLSATSLDLRTLRQAAAETLKEYAPQICKHGPLQIVYQEEFPPDYREIWEILRQLITGCDAVICLVGEVFGREPRNVPPGFSRRSYTQMEFDIAQALRKPVFLFLAEERTALDAHKPEAEDLRELQQRYRRDLQAQDHVYNAFRTKEDLLGQLQQLELTSTISLDDLLGTSGLWTPVPNTDWSRWRASPQRVQQARITVPPEYRSQR